MQKVVLINVSFVPACFPPSPFPLLLPPPPPPPPLLLLLLLSRNEIKNKSCSYSRCRVINALNEYSLIEVLPSSPPSFLPPSSPPRLSFSSTRFEDGASGKELIEYRGDLRLVSNYSFWREEGGEEEVGGGGGGG